MAKNKFYAYYNIKDGERGVVDSWDLCKVRVQGKQSRYKGFTTYKEASDWLEAGAKYEVNQERKEELESKKNENIKKRERLEEAIYFDAGTGRGIGVEARVTNLSGKSYLFEYFPSRVNEFGNINLGREKTNNYGELVALYCAIEIGEKERVYKIYGDSNLVLSYWSQGRYSETLPEETIKLIKAVIRKRKEFEVKGGKIDYVSGDINPADLGFHKP